MIAYAACVGSPEKFQKICLPGLQRVVQPDDLVIEAEHERSIFAAYNAYSERQAPQLRRTSG